MRNQNRKPIDQYNKKKPYVKLMCSSLKTSRRMPKVPEQQEDQRQKNEQQDRVVL
jgi:hypothetical protein